MSFDSIGTKYVGQTASQYEECRRAERKWRAEDEVAGELLREVETGARALDIPVGTGRLLSQLKARRFDAHGIDVSPDMLAIARARAVEIKTKVELGLGDIRNIPFEDGYFDIVTCLRFLNWIDTEGVEQSVKELTRVTRDKLLLGIRYLPPLSELKQHPLSVVRLGMRAMGLPRLQENRTGLFYHRKIFVDRLFERVGLEIITARHVERRIDGTDYVFFLLRKRCGQASSNSTTQLLTAPRAFADVR